MIATVEHLARQLLNDRTRPFLGHLTSGFCTRSVNVPCPREADSRRHPAGPLGYAVTLVYPFGMDITFAYEPRILKSFYRTF